MEIITIISRLVEKFNKAEKLLELFRRESIKSFYKFFVTNFYKFMNHSL